MHPCSRPRKPTASRGSATSLQIAESGVSPVVGRALAAASMAVELSSDGRVELSHYQRAQEWPLFARGRRLESTAGRAEAAQNQPLTLNQTRGMIALRMITAQPYS